ncbi:MAG: alpha/beta hydrolase [Burkholderiales bacterium]|nr:alpha/beta hydrolase [Burkholderiales bacterium]
MSIATVDYEMPRQAVILVHGLWMGGWVMQGLRLRLARRGYAAELFAYPSMAQSLDEHARRLAACISQLREPVIHLVGHSLGGLVILRCLRNHGEQRIGRIVLMGTPVRACMAGGRMDGLAGGKHLLGASREIWRNLPEAFRPGCEVGVLAGSRAWGLGRMLIRLPGTNDGVVRLEETEVAGMRDRIVLPISHSGMLVSARAARAVADFLERGAFDHGDRGAFDHGDRGAFDHEDRAAIEDPSP